MIEALLRRRGEAALALLHLLIPDPLEQSRVRRLLSEALGRPVGDGGLAVLDALTSTPALGAWLREQNRSSLRPPVRYLTAEVPAQVGAGDAVSVVVRLTRGPGDLAVPLRARPAGTTVTLSAWAPGLEPLGPLRHDLMLPAGGDSDLVEFGFRAPAGGVHRIRIRAFAGGTFLGEVSTLLTVQDGVAVGPGPRTQVALPSVDREPGEVTLEIERTQNQQYRVRLVSGESGDPALLPVPAGDARQAVAELLAELRRLAAGRSGFATAAATQGRLRNLGVQLWATAVPPAVRERFWDLNSGIRSFRVISSVDPVPWELMYPMDRGHDRGFLVDQFPVVRYVEGQVRRPHLRLRSAAYVVSRQTPRNADEEIGRVRELLGPGVKDLGRVTGVAELTAFLTTPPGLFHFACHTDGPDGEAPRLTLAEGPFQPVDLAVAAQRRDLADAAPVVFLNACRSADEIPGLSGPVGWARQFMAAGAGAFLGTLWPVSSRAAADFSAAFYDSLASGRTLGGAVSEARARLANEAGDPARLAYTVYGDAGTTARIGTGDDD